MSPHGQLSICLGQTGLRKGVEISPGKMISVDRLLA